MLVIMHAKFEVNSCCGWDFRQGKTIHKASFVDNQMTLFINLAYNKIFEPEKI